MKVFIDCPKCGTRHYWNTALPNQECPRCQALAGRDVELIIAELKKNKAPGQDHILHILEILNSEIRSLKMRLGG